MTPLLEAQNVTRVFGGGLLTQGQTVAVDGVSLIINEDKQAGQAEAKKSRNTAGALGGAASAGYFGTIAK